MFYKVLVLDLDGTLLDSSHELSDENLDSLRLYQRAGGIVVLATGKLYHSVADLCHTLQLKTPQILGNGYVLASPDGELVECMGYMTREQVEAAERAFNHAGLHYVYYGTQDIWFEEGCVDKSDRDKLVALGESEPKSLSSEDLKRLDKVIKVLAFCEDNESEKSVREAIESRDDLWLYRSSPLFVEIAKTGIDKGLGLKRLLDLIGKNPEETVVVGDSENDLPMFAVAGLAVAMGQAPANVKDKAGLVTGHHDESGVAQFIRDHILTSD